MRNQTQFLVLQLAIELIRALRIHVVRIAARDKSLADQIRRSASSVALNLAEANGSSGGTRRARLETALGSARETRAALAVAEAWGYLEPDPVVELDGRLDRIAAMTFNLHRR
jgi:four helix bundle protein